jgi:hypothetical protein
MYAVLFQRALEIYSVDSDTPLHKIAFDSQQTGFDFVSATCIIVSDEKARLTVLTNVHDAEKVQMKIVETEFGKFRSVVAQ